MEFKHPKYYKELRKLRNKLDQAISSCSGSTELAQRAPGPGLKLQAANKPQATSKPEPVQVQETTSVKPQQTSSDKPQALHNRRQASSLK
jgi:hypothetical protein